MEPYSMPLCTNVKEKLPAKEIERDYEPCKNVIAWCGSWEQNEDGSAGRMMWRQKVK